MPNPDGTLTDDEMRAMFGNLSSNPPPAGATTPTATRWKDPNSAPFGVPDAKTLGGRYATRNDYMDNPSELFSNLSSGEQFAKMQGDFGLGSNNNAETAAMLKAAQATGNRYSSAFGGAAARAGDASAAAAARGLGMYGGDTSQYQQGLANAQNSRGMQTGAYDALMNFANGPQGPSAAQAQLRSATDANTQNALALARSGRGMGGGQAALRQAIGQNATTQQEAANQAAALRANEFTAYQQQRLAAMNTAGGIAGQTVQGDQNYGQLGLAGAQYATDTALKGTQLNDASAQAWADRQNAALQQGMGAEMGAQTQGLNINATALAGRESQWASANQTHGIDTGNATQAGIADANRQQAYVAGGLSAAGTVLGALSDEREKNIIQPLGTLGGNGVKPLASQAPPQAAPEPIPSKAAADDAQKSATGSAVGGAAGSVVGGVAGGAVAGPVGAAIGGTLGNIAGKALGKVFSDIRSKTNVRPLSDADAARYEPGDDLNAPPPDRDAYSALSALADKYGAGGVADSPKQVKSYAQGLADRLGVPLEEKSYGQRLADRLGLETTVLRPEQEAGFRKWLKTNNVRDLDHPDSHYDYRGAYLAGEGRGADSGHFTDRFKQHGHPTFSTQSQYSTGPKDGGDWIGDDYLPSAPQGASDRTARRFARDESHPILSEGDALLADSARNAPGSMYEYKDPTAPGAAPGVQTGPMAQDLAAHPVTRGMVGKDARTGKLFVDGARAATVGLAQNHAQQNQLDVLNNRIAELEGMLKRKPGDERATNFKPKQPDLSAWRTEPGF